ncbi:N-acetylmuramoyl-L-alanine amidase family protein [Flagellimonas allohymeniacidonis]|uniref:N-acetylmuramoyl-L-alanine amidase n=1 Tax=Flagellimonas allohymeniacidonis TaxID=2517819 RepID=A0A4Q8QJY5_9FLAO|nr:N-acetylmuramoyl-L-alanine amidase [Allomuricauda hymeniacidonis]TAI48546.1 N-acetylmuramoyl-L-alanine amidase [Allomuricauda hymeniacidonis]
MNTCRFAFFFVLLLIPPLSSFTKNNTELLQKDKFVVVLDAGHGGHDPGNLGNGYLEKNIALQIVLSAGRELEKDPDIKVVYTRKDDTFVDLFVRGKIANEANADLFVSVHCDSHSSDAHGAGTFVLGLHANRQNFEVAKKENSVIYLEDNYEERYAQYDINSPESVIGLTIMQEEFLQQSIYLGKKLQDNFTKSLKRKDRKVEQAGFIVLHQTFMPSVLVETGFLTNKNEGGYLNSTKGQNEMGKAIAKAIKSYKADLGSGLELETPKEKVEDSTVDLNIPKETSSTNEKVSSQETKPKETKPEETKVVENTEVASNTTEKQEPTAKKDVIFKVQLMASSRNINLTPGNFRGLDMLSKEPYKNLYRYMYGNAESYEEAKRLKTKADAQGYTTSYIVAYKSGERVPLKSVVK